MKLRLQALERDHGIVLTPGELDWLWAQNSPGKPHLGGILRDRGLAPDLDGAIRTYLKNVPGRDRIEAKTAVEAILAAGGFPVWAHPLGGEGEKRLSPEKFRGLLAALTAYGIKGLECRYSRYSEAEATFLTECAQEWGLVPTGGSDYHGSNKKGIVLGGLGAYWAVDIDELYGIICK